MTPEKHPRAGELFDRLLDLPLEHQRSQLDEACGQDDELRQYVCGLLEAERQAPDSFLARPAVQDAVNRIAERASTTPTVTGVQLGTYVVGPQIGAGGMGSVYEARDVRLDRKVAVKILPPAFITDPDRVRRFRQEARVASLLNHPNIVSIYDAELDKGRCYIATEFVEGKTLRQLGAAGPVDLSLLLDAAIQICSALGAAHQAGIVHRDIKPENVMVRPDGIVKVLDFGLAKLTDPAGSQPQNSAPLLSGPGLIAGTVQYLSPEQVLGKPAIPQSDIFSLGVMLYELATGVRPFTGPTDGAIISAILHDQPARPSDLRPSLSRDLDALILRAIEKDPELRFQSAYDLRSALKLALRGSQPGSGPRIGAASSTGRRSRRTAAWVAGAAAIVVLAALPVALRPGPELLPHQFTKLTDSPGEEIYPNLAPDGSQFLFASAARGKWDIYLQRTGGNAATNLTADSPDDDTEPTLSRDGSHIAFRSERGRGGLFVMERTGENPTRVSSTGHLPAWSPDGKSIVYSDATFVVPSERGLPVSRLHIIDLTSGAQRELPTADAIQPNWSPHGYRIAYWGMVRGAQRDIWTVALDGSKPVAVTSDAPLDWNPVWSASGDELYFISDRGGSMNVWRVGIDERTGKTRGAPRPVTMPAAYVKYLHLSADGKNFIYSQAQRRFNLYSVEFDRAAMEPIGEPSPAGLAAGAITNFSFSPDGSKIVYDTVGESHEDLWISGLNGSGRRRLTTGGLNRAPRWSPSGDEIAFFSNRRGFYDQWLIHPDGGGLRQLTAVTSAAGQVQAAVWLDRGKLLVNRQSGGPSILDTSVVEPVSDPPSLPGFVGADRIFLFFSPPVNGTLVGQIESSANALVRYSLARNVMDVVPVDGFRPILVPGNDHMVVYKRGGVCFLYDLESRREKKLFSVGPNTIYSMAFGPTGSRLYFSQTILDADLWLGQTGSSK